MKTIEIYSPYECLAVYKEQSLMLEQNEHVVFDNFNENEKISIYPINKNKQYAFEISLKEKDCKFYRSIEKDKKIIIFLLDGLITENIAVFQLNYNNEQSKLEVLNDKIIFSTDNHKKLVYLPTKITNIKVGNFKFINYIKFDNQNSQSIITYNIKTNKAKLFQGKNIEIKDNGFIVNEEENSIYQNMSNEYIVDNEGLKNKEKIYSLSSQILPNKLVCYEFIYHIKLKEYEKAYDLLSKSLKNNISMQSLKDYFGNISYFYFLDSKTCFAISNEKNVIYEFSTQDDKIDEIIDSN